MVFPIAGGNESKGYEISNSLRLNDDDSAYLSRTNSSGGSRQIFTTSFWIKRGNFTGNGMKIFDAGTSTSTDTGRLYIGFFGTDKLAVVGGATTYRTTTQVFRDPSAWYHIVVAVDSTDGTADNRVKIYVNGNQVTAFDTNNAMTQNQNTPVNESTKSHQIGRNQPNTSEYYDGYITEFHHIDGQQKAQTDFGEFDDNGVWIPKKYTGTYGTNGVFLQFKQTGTSQNSSGIGADTSGNDNHFAVTNLAATDVTEDTCTNNFATLNSLATFTSGVLSEGNTKHTGGDGNLSKGFSTIAVSSGKWYAEVKILNGSMKSRQGVRRADKMDFNDNEGVTLDYAFIYKQGTEGGTNESITSWSGNNNIIGIALNKDDNQVSFYVNGVQRGNTQSLVNTTEAYCFFSDDYSGSGDDEGVWEWNYGNPPYAVSSSNNDGKYGNFEYAPPSGYYALCTKRLAEFG